MNLEQLQLGQDLAKDIKEVTAQINAWKNAVNIHLVITGCNYFFEADKWYIDFNVIRSLAICKLEEKLKTLQEQFNNL